MDELERLCERAGALRRRVIAAEVQPMLAEARDEAFDDQAWLYELKYDGFRAIAGRDGDEVAIHYRRGSNATAVFPDLVEAIRALRARTFVADGEIVVLDRTGRPVFQRLQKRALLTAPRDLARAAAELPATWFVFDLLALGEWDLRPLPLVERKKLLARVIPREGPVRAVEHVEGHGRALLASVRELGLEGIVAKRAASPYRGGRFRDWQKVRVDRVADFAVVGFTRAEGSRSGFGALHVATCAGGMFTYVGRVGGGFDEKELAWARAQLEPDRVPRPPCGGPLPVGAGHTWVQPRLVVEVRYKEITKDGLLRQPTFLRFRPDKPPLECAAPGARREVPLTNTGKIFWPAEGITKGDLIAWYRSIARWLLPYLRDRPLMLTRYPDGIDGKSFYQKNAPSHVPPWVRTERIDENDTFICNDVETLTWLANLGTIPLHVWSARVATLQRPDWCILDLDPKDAPFAQVVQLALAAKQLCDELKLPAYCKTSGQKGMHVLIPLGTRLSHDESTSFAELLARVIEARHPAIATTERVIARRKGRVYVDYLQNGYGRTIAAPFSARPVAGATVSMPLRWSEVDEALDPRAFTLRNALARMDALGDDPLRPVLDEAPDVEAALRRLARVVA